MNFRSTITLDRLSVFEGSLKYSGRLTLLLFLFFLAGCGHPSDRELEERFYAHEGEFEKLIRMSQEDERVVRVAPSFTWLENDVRWPRPESQLGFTAERWNEYRTLFRALGLPTGISKRMDKLGRRAIVFMPASSAGLVTGGSAKGYAYSEGEPSPIVDSIDESFKESKSMQPIFRRLKGNWYLFYEWDD